MALLVQKFGGSSLATLAHINRVADLIAKAKQASHQVVVIVSAMAGETDRLIQLANNLSQTPDPREYAALVATGEQVSMALMAIALMNRGLKARSYSGAQAGIQTCSQYKKARIQSINVAPILEDLAQGTVVVIAGFQGVDEGGSITTLGRGGSDTTAVAIAAALKADECQIYTDVDGIYTTDPKIVSAARRLDQITFEEMLELSSLGAKVLQIRAVEFAGKYEIPLRVLSSLNEGPGTLITYQQPENMEGPLVRGIAFNRKEAKITLCGIDTSAESTSRLFMIIKALNVNVDMIFHHMTADNKMDFTFTVHHDEYEATLAQLEKIDQDLGFRQIMSMSGLAKLSIVGSGLKSHPDVLTVLFKSLSDQNIPVHLMVASEIKISILVDAHLLDEGVRVLHMGFQLEENKEAENLSLNLVNGNNCGTTAILQSSS